MLRPSTMLATLLAVAALAGAATAGECQDADANWIFCSDFEEGALSIWDDYDGNPAPYNTVRADPGPHGEPDNHVMRLYVPPGAGTADLVKELPSRHDKLYLRWYQLWEDGYDFDAANHGSGLHAGPRSLLARSGYRPDGADRFNAAVEPSTRLHRLNIYSYYRGMYQDCTDPDGGCWGDLFPCMADDGRSYCTEPAHREHTLPPVMETGRWYCIEMMVDGGTPTDDPAAADGQIDLWIDGVQYGPWTDLWMRTDPGLELSMIWMKLYHHGQHADAGVLIDDIVVSTEPIGPSGGTVTGVPGDDQPAGGGWSDMKALFR